MDRFLPLFIGQIVGYLVGALPFGYLIARWRAGIDIRQHGSGNIGATNVGRVLGFPYFILTFSLDFAKGMGPVLAAMYWQQSQPGPEIPLPEVVGFAAILGHVFPIYLRFKGGKGVATTIGVLVTLLPGPCLAGMVSWFVFLLVSRMVSLSSIAFAITFAVYYFVMEPNPLSAASVARTSLVILVALLVLWKHRSNVVRIVGGREPFVRMPWQRKIEVNPPSAGMVQSTRAERRDENRPA